VAKRELSARPTNRLRSRHPLGRGRKSAGEASSTLIESSSFKRGIARSTSSCSGSSFRCTSTVVARHPRTTAVAPPVK
jgi:hypothetical protein